MRKLLERKEKIKIIDMIKREKSLNEISKSTGRSKTTIYYHMRKIRGKQSFDKLEIPRNPSIQGEFLGMFAGDGYFFFDPKTYHYTFLITLSKKFDDEYSEYIIEMFRKYFKKKVRKYYHENRIRLMFESKKLFEFVKLHLEIKNKTYNVRLKRNLDEYTLEFLSAFVRGVMDTDGYVRSRNSVGLGMASKGIIYQISEILQRLGIENEITVRKPDKPNWSPIYIITVRNPHISKFKERINFSNSRKREKLI